MSSEHHHEIILAVQGNIFDIHLARNFGGVFSFIGKSMEHSCTHHCIIPFKKMISNTQLCCILAQTCHFLAITCLFGICLCQFSRVRVMLSTTVYIVLTLACSQFIMNADKHLVTFVTSACLSFCSFVRNLMFLS